MKILPVVVLLCGLASVLGCQPTTPVASSESPVSTASKTVVDAIVEASCGECQFGMEGKACDLAVRIDGNTYFVDGSKLDDHGNAHADDGMCSCVRKAKVTGEIKDGRFVASAFELQPLEDASESEPH